MNAVGQPLDIQRWFSVLMFRNGMEQTITITATDARDARCSAKDMYPGWRIGETWEVTDD